MCLHYRCQEPAVKTAARSVLTSLLLLDFAPEHRSFRLACPALLLDACYLCILLPQPQPERINLGSTLCPLSRRVSELRADALRICIAVR